MVSPARPCDRERAEIISAGPKPVNAEGGKPGRLVNAPAQSLTDEQASRLFCGREAGLAQIVKTRGQRPNVVAQFAQNVGG